MTIGCMQDAMTGRKMSPDKVLTTCTDGRSLMLYHDLLQHIRPLQPELCIVMMQKLAFNNSETRGITMLIDLDWIFTIVDVLRLLQKPLSGMPGCKGLVCTGLQRKFATCKKCPAS